jgi:predicted AAA+ superfamily ATPase
MNSFTTGSFEQLNQKELLKRNKSIDQYLIKGGLPGICFLREERLIVERLYDLHRLILDRDLRMVHQTKISLEVLSQFLGLIATFGLQGYSYTEVKNQLQLSPVTQKALLFALESIFLIRRIPIYGGSKGEIILFEDQLEERILANKQTSIEEQLCSLVYRNLRAQFQYRMGLPISIKSYWTRNNARVPLVISGFDSTLGVISIESDEASLSQIRAAESLLKFEGNSKVLILSKTLKTIRIINSRMALVPIANVI